MTLPALPAYVTPRPDPVLNVWWIGAQSPGWLTDAAPVATVAGVDDLPTDADPVVARVAGADALSLTASLRARCADARLLLLVDDLTGPLEADLLEAGVTFATDATHVMAPRRMRAVIGSLGAPAADNAAPERRQRAFGVASHLLATMHDERETFQQLVHIIARELHSRRVSLLQVDHGAGVLVMRAAVGISAEVMAVARPRIGEGIAGTCARLGKPLYIDDHSRARGSTDLTAFVPDDDHGAPPAMSLTVPILVKGEVVGVVNVTDRDDNRPYSRRDIDFVAALMGHAGFLLENAQLMTNLRSERAFTQRVLDTLAEPLVVVDRGLSVVAANQAFERAFGGAEGALGEQLGSDGPAHAAQLAGVIAEGAQDTQEFAGWHLGERVFDVRLTPFDDADRQRFLLFMHDVTARHVMERRLVSAEKMASLGVLAAGVAHEINNPIGFVKANIRSAGGFMGDLFDVVDAWRAAALAQGTVAHARSVEEEVDLDGLREDAPRMVQEMVEGVERVEKIVAGLKTFAHPDTQKAQQADLRELLDNAALLTQGKWKYSLELETDYADVAPIVCLGNQLEQVFMNLIVNAAQAADGWGKLRIEARDLPDGRVRLRFIDDCGGIPADIVDKIFDPFFTTKDIGEGTGLGLAISYNIIETHGGTLKVAVREGEGTTFVIELPRGAQGQPMVVKQQSRFRI